MARLLIVDDDPDILRMGEKILTQAGHQIATADSALKAMDLLNSSPFDLMVSDANMPLYSGFELIQTVRANPKLNHMSVIMLTGLRERKDVDKAVRAGVDDYIVKPLDPMLLIQKVNALIDKRQPLQKPEIHFARESAAGVAQVSLQVQMESISELGVVIATNLPLTVGQTLDLRAPFFTQLSDTVPPLKVLSCAPIDATFQFRIELQFLGAPESFLQKIRRYIFTHGASHRAVG